MSPNPNSESQLYMATVHSATPEEAAAQAAAAAEAAQGLAFIPPLTGLLPPHSGATPTPTPPQAYNPQHTNKAHLQTTAHPPHPPNALTVPSVGSRAPTLPSGRKPAGSEGSSTRFTASGRPVPGRVAINLNRNIDVFRKRDHGDGQSLWALYPDVNAIRYKCPMGMSSPTANKPYTRGWTDHHSLEVDTTCCSCTQVE